MPRNDGDRPPVLAHRRFVADRAAYADLDLAQRFQKIHETNLWGADTSVSGLGSELDATAVLRAELPPLLAGLRVSSLLWINSAALGVTYTGVDIVPALVQRLRMAAAAGHIRGEYLLADITCDPLPKRDAILCRDAMVHLSFRNIARAIANFQASGAQWLIATTFPDWQTNRDCDDGDWRPLNLACAPFGWGQPVALVNERCTEAGGGWDDKSLGLWPLAGLPPMA